LSAALKAVEKRLRAHGLAKPEAYEEFPWGDRAPGDEPPVGILCDWIDESYALVAPKKRVNRSSAGPR
jgi:hypothetical protein